MHRTNAGFFFITSDVYTVSSFESEGTVPKVEYVEISWTIDVTIPDFL